MKKIRPVLVVGVVLLLGAGVFGYNRHVTETVSCSDVAGMVEYCHVGQQNWGWPWVYRYETEHYLRGGPVNNEYEPWGILGDLTVLGAVGLGGWWWVRRTSSRK
jgi:hypothetical protein